MEWYLWSIIIFALLLSLMAVGLPIAFCFMIVDVVGVYALWGSQSGLYQLAVNLYASVTNFSLLPVPLFILMGDLMFQSGIGTRMIEAIDKWVGRLPGRLGLLATIGGTVLGALTGASMASVAILGSVLLPEMKKRGYKDSMAMGSILASGGLAVLIPPSALAVLFASIAQVSVGKVLMAIIGPGLLLAFFYCLYIIGRCSLQPSIAPAYDIGYFTIRYKVVAIAKYVLPLGFIIFSVIGVILLGIASATEASALGAVATFVLAIFYEGFKWEMIKKSVLNTIQVTSMIFMILMWAKVFGQILAFTGVVQGLVEVIKGLDIPAIMTVALLQFVVLIMGCFMESVSIMMITAPIFMPIIYALNFDPVWFSALMVLNIEIGVITPPFGTNLFVMKGLVPNTPMERVYLSVYPFVAIQVVALALIMIFPVIALWLPNLTQF